MPILSATIGGRSFEYPPEGQESIDNSIKCLRDVEIILEYVKNFGTCVQAGGNLGVFPYLFSERFDQVHTFEPDKGNYSYLLKNIGNIENITPHSCALGEKEKQTGLILKPQNLGAHYIGDGSDISMRTIDSFEFRDVGLIQLDVEGYEFKVLQGAVTTIGRYQPVVVVEDKGHGVRYGDEQFSCRRLLQERFGYKLVQKVNRDYIFAIA